MLRRDDPFFPIHFRNFPLIDDDLTGWDQMTRGGLSISEDKEHVYVEADMPGLKIEDIEITYEKGTLWIHGERKEEEKNKDKKYYKKASQSFSYRILVPGSIDEKKEPQASYKNGILKVAFAKQVPGHGKKIKVS